MVRSRTLPTRGALASLFHGLLPNQFHIKTQSDESQFISQVLQSDIIISIPDQVFLNPRSLVEQLKLIHTNMDNHYDNIAAVLAKYRSGPFPIWQAPLQHRCHFTMDKTYDSNTISFERGSRGEWGPRPIHPENPFQGKYCLVQSRLWPSFSKLETLKAKAVGADPGAPWARRDLAPWLPISLNMITPNDVTKWFLSAPPFTKCPDAAAQHKTIKQPQGQQSYTCWSPCSVGSQVRWNIGWQLREWTNRRLYIIYLSIFMHHKWNWKNNVLIRVHSCKYMTSNGMA